MIFYTSVHNERPVLRTDDFVISELGGAKTFTFYYVFIENGDFAKAEFNLKKNIEENFAGGETCFNYRAVRPAESTNFKDVLINAVN